VAQDRHERPTLVNSNIKIFNNPHHPPPPQKNKKSFGIVWQSSQSRTKVCSKYSVGIVTTATPCAQNCVVSLYLELWRRGVRGWGNSEAVSNNLKKNTFAYNCIIRSLQMEVTNTTSHDMQAYKQSTGQITLYHSGGANN